MSTHTCADRWCVRPADIKVGDQNLCAKHWKQNTEWVG